MRSKCFSDFFYFVCALCMIVISPSIKAQIAPSNSGLIIQSYEISLNQANNNVVAKGLDENQFQFYFQFRCFGSKNIVSATTNIQDNSNWLMLFEHSKPSDQWVSFVKQQTYDSAIVEFEKLYFRNNIRDSVILTPRLSALLGLEERCNNYFSLLRSGDITQYVEKKDGGSISDLAAKVDFGRTVCFKDYSTSGVCKARDGSVLTNLSNYGKNDYEIVRVTKGAFSLPAKLSYNELESVIQQYNNHYIVVKPLIEYSYFTGDNGELSSLKQKILSSLIEGGIYEFDIIDKSTIGEGWDVLVNSGQLQLEKAEPVGVLTDGKPEPTIQLQEPEEDTQEASPSSSVHQSKRVEYILGKDIAQALNDYGNTVQSSEFIIRMLPGSLAVAFVGMLLSLFIFTRYARRDRNAMPPIEIGQPLLNAIEAALEKRNLEQGPPNIIEIGDEVVSEQISQRELEQNVKAQPYEEQNSLLGVIENEQTQDSQFREGFNELYQVVQQCFTALKSAADANGAIVKLKGQTLGSNEEQFEELAKLKRLIENIAIQTAKLTRKEYEDADLMSKIAKLEEKLDAVSRDYRYLEEENRITGREREQESDRAQHAEKELTTISNELSTLKIQTSEKRKATENLELLNDKLESYFVNAKTALLNKLDTCRSMGEVNRSSLKGAVEKLSWNNRVDEKEAISHWHLAISICSQYLLHNPAISLMDDIAEELNTFYLAAQCCLRTKGVSIIRPQLAGDVVNDNLLNNNELAKGVQYVGVSEEYRDKLKQVLLKDIAVNLGYLHHLKNGNGKPEPLANAIAEIPTITNAVQMKQNVEKYLKNSPAKCTKIGFVGLRLPDGERYGEVKYENI